MIQAILLPCNFFEINQVDFSYQNEYDALVKRKQFQIYFYDYDTFIADGILKLNKQPNEITSTVFPSIYKSMIIEEPNVNFMYYKDSPRSYNYDQITG